MNLELSGNRIFILQTFIIYSSKSVRMRRCKLFHCFGGNENRAKEFIWKFHNVSEHQTQTVLERTSNIMNFAPCFNRAGFWGPEKWGNCPLLSYGSWLEVHPFPMTPHWLARTLMINSSVSEQLSLGTYVYFSIKLSLNSSIEWAQFNSQLSGNEWFTGYILYFNKRVFSTFMTPSQLERI